MSAATASREVDGVLFTQEGPGVSATGHGQKSFFVETTLDTMVAAYEKAMQDARRLFGSRAPSSPLIDPIARESTFHWLYVYAVNRQPLVVVASDWEHPQTWRIIQDIVEHKHRPLSPEAVADCSRFIGISPAEYQHWRASDELFAMR